ncbi:hypothetical protein SO802_015501 [Lithocarpus litseifolius]|uniref:DNA ligase ATP-dependent N-terminal domain-containing protein n=1 Tax=Lithocarpus litseifolius TaxID=425828 RepID=A0AAW2CY04_9ROSI
MDRNGGGDEPMAEWSLGVGGRQMRVARGRDLSTEIEAHRLERVEHLKSKMPELKNKCWDFDPRLVTCWDEGEPVSFMFLCLGFDMISKESGLIVKMDILCNVLRTVMDTTANDVLSIVYLLANRIVPTHEGLELGIGEASIINVLAEAYGRTKVGHRKLDNQLGDWGLVAKACRSS